MVKTGHCRSGRKKSVYWHAKTKNIKCPVTHAVDIDTVIKQIESTRLEEAYGFCKGCFSGTYLPSHDETHHLRAWHFAKTLIPGYHKAIQRFTPEQIEGILLAVMLHDTGMAETTDVTHGRASRRLAETFFAGMVIPPALTAGILIAVKKHDDKSYSSALSAASDEGIILSVLSTADDMDAFGTIGVFRYYEIYSLRNVKVKEMAGEVLPNLDRRYEVMGSKLQCCPEAFSDTGRRYLITRRFFEDLKAGDSRALKVTDIFEHSIRAPRKKPEAAIPEILRNFREPYVSGFFNRMQEEVTSFRKPGTDFF